ncbi:MAG: tRNA (adenine-N1)-methyltransferase [Candidatus Manganitrophaceae bacterium]
MKPLASGQGIHLVNKKGDRYPLTLKAGATFQFSGETIPHDAIIGLEDGSEITLSRGARFWVFRPTLAEYTLHMPRGAQILYPKDLALICMWADIYPGAMVVEAGIGSGALTMTMLNAVGEKGRVISYEIREDFARRAAVNIESYLGEAITTDRLRVRRQDIYEGIEEEEVDRIVLDLPEPHRVVPHAAIKLRPGGIFLSFVPTVPQIELVVAALQREPGFIEIETFETLLRTWNIDGRSVRPDLRMIAHSGFITTARRVKRFPKKEAAGADPDLKSSE